MTFAKLTALLVCLILAGACAYVVILALAPYTRLLAALVLGGIVASLLGVCIYGAYEIVDRRNTVLERRARRRFHEAKVAILPVAMSRAANIKMTAAGDVEIVHFVGTGHVDQRDRATHTPDRAAENRAATA